MTDRAGMNPKKKLMEPVIFFLISVYLITEIGQVVNNSKAMSWNVMFESLSISKIK